MYCSVFNTFLERFLNASYTQKNIKPVIILPCKNCVFILFCKVSSNYRLVFVVWLNLLKIPPPPAWTRRAASVSSRPDVCGVSCGTTRNFPRDGGARERGRRSAIGGWCYVGGPPKRPPRRDCPAGRGRWICAARTSPGSAAAGGTARSPAGRATRRCGGNWKKDFLNSIYFLYWFLFVIILFLGIYFLL